MGLVAVVIVVGRAGRIRDSEHAVVMRSGLAPAEQSRHPRAIKLKILQTNKQKLARGTVLVSPRVAILDHYRNVYGSKRVANF